MNVKHISRVVRARRLLALAAIGSLSLAACGLVEEEKANAEDTVEIVINGIGAAGDHNMAALEAFAEELEEGSDGSLTTVIHEPNTLLPTPEALSGAGAGVADVAIVVSSAHPNELPTSVWMGALASQIDKAFPAGQLEGGAAVNEMFLSNDAIQAEYEKQNVKILNSNVYGQQFDMLCSKPVTSMADLKGLRVRSPGPVWTELASDLGMAPTFLTNADIFEALQRGVIDCEISPPEAHVTAGSIEVAQDYLPVPLTGNMGGYTMVMNLDTWNSLSDAQKEVVNRAAAVHWSSMAQAEIEAPLTFVEQSEKYKVTLHTPPQDMLTAIAAAQAKQVEGMVKTAPEGVGDAQGFIDQFMGLVDKWHAELPQDAFVNPGQAATFETYQTASEKDFSGYYAIVDAYFDARDTSGE